MLCLVVALLCGQPSADVLPVLYIEREDRVEFALTNRSDQPLTFVTTDDDGGQVYGAEFGLILDGTRVEPIYIDSIVFGRLTSKVIEPGESLPVSMSPASSFYPVKTGRYELTGWYKMEGEQMFEQAVTPLDATTRGLAILEIGGRFPFNQDQDVYPVVAPARGESPIDFLPVRRGVSPAARLEFALVNTSDQPLMFAQDRLENVVPGLEFSLLQDGEPLEKAPQRDTPPYVSRVVGPGEALRVSMTPAFFQPKPGRYELAASYKMEDEQVEGLAVTPFEMPARVVAILEIGEYRIRDQPKEP